ncbi:AMP-binding protein [Actinoplanes sp. NPDC026623]|uniref:AMP-binding protein n=1 Tax=Actinoplanes sp. NPDC026623 TaxID=3155610 RepID=UPI0033E42015
MWSTELPLTGPVERAAARPDAPAVITAGGELSYRHLVLHAQEAAAWLRARGIGRGDVVGLVMRPGPEQVIGILAAALAGAAYLPVDAGLSAERRGYLLRTAGVRCLLSNAPGAEPAALPLAGRASQAGPFAVPSADDLAYLRFALDPAGRTRGVLVRHRDIARVVADCTARFGVDAGDRFFGVSAFDVDRSVIDVFGALSVGAAVVLPDVDRAADPDHWLDLCETHGVTVWNSGPAAAARLFERAAGDPSRLGTLRLVMVSGDRIPPGLPAALLRLKPDLEVAILDHFHSGPYRSRNLASILSAMCQQGWRPDRNIR